VKSKSSDCNVVVVGAGPYGLSAAAYLRAAGVEARVFGEPMAFWQKQMPVGMCLRSNWGASHIADPKGELTLDVRTATTYRSRFRLSVLSTTVAGTSAASCQM
jgi:cation diffusion facilitator CzcD-associated flavoprotein CzcO